MDSQEIKGGISSAGWASFLGLSNSPFTSKSLLINIGLPTVNQGIWGS